MARAAEVTMTQTVEDKKGDIVLILSLAVIAGEEKKVPFFKWMKETEITVYFFRAAAEWG